MPGRTPYAAFQAFIQPLEAAIACLGSAKITVSHGGKSVTDTTHSWALGEGAGMGFEGGFLFKAAMSYRIVDFDGGGYRVTTESYMYSLIWMGRELWAMHWHPAGLSNYSEPHLHVASIGDGKPHLPAPRMSLENAVGWVIESGVSPARSDWEAVLDASHRVHVQYRTWHTHTGAVPLPGMERPPEA